jgi:hypothetical protein
MSISTEIPINHSNLAYTDSDIIHTDKYEQWLRTFEPTVDTKLLDWHVDGNRTLNILQSDEQWSIQFANDQPILLSVGMVIESPADTLHRLIRNNPTSQLIVRITEFHS